MISKTKEGRLESIDVVRWQDRKIHILGRREENISSDASSFRAYHIIHDEQTGKIISEDSFLYRGNFPLFMCGCYILSCEGTCLTLLDHELSLKIHENRLKADKYDDSISKFKEANLSDLRKEKLQKT
ncbi:MAG: hypothetical protein JSV13_09480 [Nitrospiraceae bacterium]|nr:MAG: hypothetical protein JSV13_09480 [Nitrospiraceae bacterium]